MAGIWHRLLLLCLAFCLHLFIILAVLCPLLLRLLDIFGVLVVTVLPSTPVAGLMNRPCIYAALYDLQLIRRSYRLVVVSVSCIILLHTGGSINIPGAVQIR